MLLVIKNVSEKKGCCFIDWGAWQKFVTSQLRLSLKIKHLQKL